MKTYYFEWDDIRTCCDCPLEDYGECLLTMDSVDILKKPENCPLKESEVEE